MVKQVKTQISYQKLKIKVNKGLGAVDSFRFKLGKQDMVGEVNYKMGKSGKPTQVRSMPIYFATASGKAGASAGVMLGDLYGEYRGGDGRSATLMLNENILSADAFKRMKEGEAKINQPSYSSVGANINMKKAQETAQKKAVQMDRQLDKRLRPVQIPIGLPPDIYNSQRYLKDVPYADLTGMNISDMYGKSTNPTFLAPRLRPTKVVNGVTISKIYQDEVKPDRDDGGYSSYQGNRLIKAKNQNLYEVLPDELKVKGRKKPPLPQDRLRGKTSPSPPPKPAPSPAPAPQVAKPEVIKSDNKRGVVEGKGKNYHKFFDENVPSGSIALVHGDSRQYIIVTKKQLETKVENSKMTAKKKASVLAKIIKKGNEFMTNDKVILNLF